MKILTVIIVLTLVSVGVIGAGIGMLFLAPVLIGLALLYFVVMLVKEFTSSKNTKQQKMPMLKRLIIVLGIAAAIYFAPAIF